MDKSNLLTAAVAGAVMGSLAWFVLKPVVNAALEKSIREQLQTQIPQQLNTQLDAKLRQYGFTPETGQVIARLVTQVGRSGLI